MNTATFLEPVSEKRKAELRPLYLECHETELMKSETFATKAFGLKDRLETFFASLKENDDRFVILEKEGTIRAFCVLCNVKHQFPGKLQRVSSFTVVLSEQRQQFGRQLMRALQDYSKAEGITLYGWTHTSLPYARKFFSDLGCHESHTNFPEQPRESDMAPTGWICLWYPKPVYTSEEKKQNWVLILVGEEKEQEKRLRRN